MEILSSIHLSFIFLEISTYILFVICLIHAVKRGIGCVTELLGGLLFGIILEYVNVTFLANYHYGKFFIMFGGIPLCIGVGWAIIIYSSMALSDRLGLSSWTRPIADAFLALNIDLSMDIIAIRLGDGMWVWGWVDETSRWTSDWFGVPFGNFFGWFFVVLLYSGTVRTARYIMQLQNWNIKWKLVYPFLSVIVSQLLLTALLMVYTTLWQKGIPSWVMFAVPVTIALILLLFNGRPRPVDDPAGWIIHAVPMSFHILFLTSVFVFRINAWTPWILPVSISMFIIGLIIQIAVIRSRNKNRLTI